MENTNKVTNGTFLRYDLVQEVNGKRIVLKSSQDEKEELEKNKEAIWSHLASLGSFGIDTEPLGFVSVEPIWMIDGKEQVYYL